MHVCARSHKVRNLNHFEESHRFVTHMKTLTLRSPCKGIQTNILLTGTCAEP